MVNIVFAGTSFLIVLAAMLLMLSFIFNRGSEDTLPVADTDREPGLYR